jgi:hypothetical protein
MKSFKIFLTEDIMGGFDPNYIVRTSGRTKKIKTLDELVSKIGVNYDHEGSTRHDLNDDYHIRIKKKTSESEDDTGPGYMNVHVFSSKPGHERTALASYMLSHHPNDTIQTESGKKIKMYSGVPQKIYTNLEKGVFSLPDNFLHTIANATGFGILSGGMQSEGGIHMWRKAVRHGSKIKHHVRKLFQNIYENDGPDRLIRRFRGEWKDIGKTTNKNFQDAYTHDITRKRTGIRSNVPQNMFNLPRDADSNVSVTREGTKLAVLPK